MWPANNPAAQARVKAAWTVARNTALEDEAPGVPAQGPRLQLHCRVILHLVY